MSTPATAVDIELGKQEGDSGNNEERASSAEDTSKVKRSATDDEDDHDDAEASDKFVPMAEDENDRKFPASFYDPKTNMLMVNPVVDSNGDSCEKPLHMVDDGDENDDSPPADPNASRQKDYYPNRALRSIIQRETQRNLNSIVGSLRRLDDSARKTWNQMVDKSVLATTDYRPLPDSFYCPITQDLMVDPVIAPDGNTFEREAIVNWIRANGTNPITRQELSIAALRRNNNLYDLIQAEKNRPNIAERHPSIRRWVEANPDDATSRRTLGPEDWVEPVASSSDTHGRPATPINYAQIAEARRRRAQNDRSWTLLFLFTLIAILLFVPSHLTFFVLFVSMALLTCCKSAHERRVLERQRTELAAALAATQQQRTEEGAIPGTTTTNEL